MGNDLTAQVAGSWVLITSMVNGKDNSCLHTPSEINTVVRTFTNMRKRRHEPTLDARGKTLAAGSHDVYMIFGLSLFPPDLTRTILCELGLCLMEAFQLDAIDLVIAGTEVSMTRTLSTLSTTNKNP